MAVSLYFGLPGCGKTTLMAYKAKEAIDSGRYKNVYGNVKMKIPGYTYITNDCIGKYLLCDCKILIDEATIFADSRRFKDFDMGKLMYFLEHRHFNADIDLFTQQWDGVDRKIRVITDRVYYVYKGKLLGHWFTTYYRIPYGIIIPDPKRDKGSEKLGEIIQGYCKPNILVRIFAPKLFRPKYYKYFDSWERYYLPPLPEQFHAYWPEPETVICHQRVTFGKLLDLHNLYIKFLESCSDRWNSFSDEEKKLIDEEIVAEDTKLFAHGCCSETEETRERSEVELVNTNSKQDS